MLVYGDRWRATTPPALLAELARRLAAAGTDLDRLTAARRRASSATSRPAPPRR